MQDVVLSSGVFGVAARRISCSRGQGVQALVPPLVDGACADALLVDGCAEASRPRGMLEIGNGN